jgi:DUF4097 and DUF4098 domain-containing protein YvlB
MTTTVDDATLLLDRPIGRHGRVTIRLASAEVRLIADSTDRVTVRIPGGRTLPDWVALETADGDVKIREEDALGRTFGVARGTVRIEVGLPAEADVSINTASGWIDGLGLRGPQQYRTASGDVRVREAGGRIDVNAVSGDITLELAAPADLAIRTVSGDVSVAGGSVETLRLNTTSGDVRLESPLTSRTDNTIETLSGGVSLLATGGLRVDARTVSGDVSSDVPHRTEGSMGRRTLIVGDGATELSFRSVSGDLHIHGGAPEAPGPDPASRPTAETAATAEAADPTKPADDGPATETDPDRMAILRALEAGEIDVATAMEHLAALDEPAGESGDV